MNELLLPELIDLPVVIEFFLPSEDASHGIEIVRQTVLREDILVLHGLHVFPLLALRQDNFAHAYLEARDESSRQTWGESLTQDFFKARDSVDLLQLVRCRGLDLD